MQIRKGYVEVKLVSLCFFPLLSAFPQIITSLSKVVASVRFPFFSESKIFLDLHHLLAFLIRLKKFKNQYFYCLIPHGILQLCWNKANLSGWTNGQCYFTSPHALHTELPNRVLLQLRASLLTAHWKEKRHFKWCLKRWGVCLIKTKNNGKATPSFITEIKNSTILTPLCGWNSSHTWEAVSSGVAPHIYL